MSKFDRFIAVVARGGLIQAAECRNNQKNAEKIAIAWGDSGFDESTDDIKVFDNDGEVVFDFGRWSENEG